MIFTKENLKLARVEVCSTQKGCELRSTVISDDPFDQFPTKGYFQGTQGTIFQASWSLSGDNKEFSTNKLFLPPVSVPRSVFVRINQDKAPYPTASSDNSIYVRSDKHPADPQAVIKIVDFSAVTRGEGLTAGTERSYKLVPVE